MKLLPILYLFIFLSCSSNTLLNDDIINLTLSEKNKIIDSKIEDTEIIMQKPEKLTVLFFKKIVNNVAPISKTIENKIKKENIKSEDFQVIADWMLNNIRYIKIRNIKTEEETLIKEGTTVGNIVLIERNLFFYKFKINEDIIEVKR